MSLAILFRVDAGPRIGLGHVSRCLTLADALTRESAVTCHFVSRHMPDRVAEDITKRGHDWTALTQKGPDPDPSQGDYGQWLGTTEAHDLKETLRATNGTAFDCVIVDHYGLNAVWEAGIKEALGVRLAIIDDLDRSHAADILIDQTFGKTLANYAEKVPQSCRSLVGSQYALLRPEFRDYRDASLARQDKGQPLRKLLVSMGGMDVDNATSKVLSAIDALGRTDFETTVLLGAQAPNHETIRQQIKILSVPVTLIPGTNRVASLLSDFDACIGAPGSSSWERCCLGIPTANVRIADNQIDIARLLSEHGAVLDGGSLFNWDQDRFIETCLRPLIDQPELRQSLSQSARTICDGRGALRVVTAMTTRLIPANRSHLKLMFDWQTSPATRRYFNNPNVPSWDEHVQWFERTCADEASHIYVIEHGLNPSGVVRINPSKVEGFEHFGEVSILIDPKAYGRGLATEALKQLRLEHPEQSLVAQIKSENKGSVKAFLKAGFSHIRETYYIAEA
jgi:UDP-2,4-diacetamido-2,4,6-trideoxy-beta-L-altropyranose hydrolase